MDEKTLTADIIQKEIDIASFSADFVSTVIRSRMTECGLNSINEYAVFSQKSEHETHIFRKLLSNTYSMFFRNRLTFEVIYSYILSELTKKKAAGTEIRVWSAGCSSGQEPYSLAILFEKFNSICPGKLKYRIFATDSSYEAIEMAVLANYNKKDLGNLTISELGDWFSACGDNYKINTDLKQNIQFEMYNLLNEKCICPQTSIYGDFDLIVCANVLIYYNPQVQKKLLTNLKKSLSGDGYIVSGEAERDLFLQNDLIEIFPQSCIYKIR